MEQTLLENSKGAPYMSFILDIEVVIRRDGLRANLIETKVTGKNEDQKKKEPKEKESKEKPLSDSTTPKSSVKITDDVQVYTMNTDKKEIFEGQNTGEDEDKNKLILEKLLSRDENLEHSPSIEEKSISNKANIKKKKITKKDRKLKVFKGKVEPIDFLECNRIFMCNYLRIQRYPYTNNICTEDYKQTYVIGKKSKSFHLFHTEPPIYNTKFNCRKRGNINFTPVPILFNKNGCSFEDVPTKENIQRNIINLWHSNLFSKNNPLLNQYSHTSCMDQFQKPIIYTSSCFSKSVFLIPTNKCNFSNYNLFCEGNVLEDNIIKKSMSLPNIDNFPLLVNTNNIADYTNSSSDKSADFNILNISNDNALITRKIKKYNNIKHINEVSKYIFIEMKHSTNTTDNKLVNRFTENNGARRLKYTCGNKYLERVVSNSAIVDTRNQSTTYKTITLGNILTHRVQTDCDQQAFKHINNDLDNQNKSKASPETDIKYQNTQSLRNQQKSLRKILQNVLFMCTCKPNSKLQRNETLK